MSFAHNTVICTHHFLYLAILSYFIFILLWLLLMSPCSTCLHIPPPPPPRTVMLILIFNSTAYCHAHSLILYILYSVLYILFFIHFILCILPLLYSTIFALSMERTWLTFHCWLYNLCIVVYVTNKTWNLKQWYIAQLNSFHNWRTLHRLLDWTEWAVFKWTMIFLAVTLSGKSDIF